MFLELVKKVYGALFGTHEALLWRSWHNSFFQRHNICVTVENRSIRDLGYTYCFVHYSGNFNEFNLDNLIQLLQITVGWR